MRLRITLVVLCVLALAQNVAAIECVAEINAKDNSTGTIIAGTTAKLVLTLIADMSQAEPGEEIASIQITMSSGFSAKENAVKSVKMGKLNIPDFQSVVDRNKIIVSLPTLIILTTLVEIEFTIYAPSTPVPNRLFIVGLMNVLQNPILVSIKPGNTDGQVNNDSLSVDIVDATDQQVSPKDTALSDADVADVNMDGVVNTPDLLAVVQHFGESAPVNLTRSPDVNGDGVVNIVDLVLVCRHLPPPNPPLEILRLLSEDMAALDSAKVPSMTSYFSEDYKAAKDVHTSFGILAGLIPSDFQSIPQFVSNIVHKYAKLEVSFSELTVELSRNSATVHTVYRFYGETRSPQARRLEALVDAALYFRKEIVEWKIIGWEFRSDIEWTDLIERYEITVTNSTGADFDLRPGYSRTITGVSEGTHTIDVRIGNVIIADETLFVDSDIDWEVY